MAAATASSSVICAFTVTMKSFVSLSAPEVIVAVRVTGRSPVTGRETTPPEVMAGSLDDHETEQLSAPDVVRFRFWVTVVEASPDA